MVIDLTNLKTDTTLLISDWAEVVVIAQPSLSFSDSGFSSLSNYTIVTQSSSNTISVDFQAPQFRGRTRYIIEQMGLNVVDIYAVYCPFAIDVKSDYVILRYTEKGDTGTGTGSASTLTDATKTWTADTYISCFLIDANGIIFEITDNAATTITVSGTPVSGVYYIAERYFVRSIERNEDHCVILVSRPDKDNA